MTDRSASPLARFRSLIALGVLVAAFGVASPHFLSLDNLRLVLEQTARNAILAAGMTLVILTGGIDLSVGSVLAFSSVVAGLAMDKGVWVPGGVLISVVVGSLCGLVSGLLVGYGKLPAFIATLGMMSVCRGAALLVSGGQPISGFSPALASLWQGQIGPVPVPVIIMVAVYAVAWWMLERTAFGMHVYALGGNAKAAWLAGVHVKRTTVAVYALSGALAGLTAILVAARFNTAQPTEGATAELEAIAACVIGGASLSGGEGRILGTLVGALTMSVMLNGLNLLDVSSYTQKVVTGLVIVVAVFVDRLVHGRGR